MRVHLLTLAFACGLAAGALAAPPPVPANAPPPPHGFFSSLVRVFGRFESVDPATRTLTFVEDGSGARRTQPLVTDTDVLIQEQPAQFSDLRAGERVWLALDRGRSSAEYGAVRFVTDEPTYQALHGAWYTVEGVEPGSRAVTLVAGARLQGQRLTLPAAAGFRLRAGSRQEGLEALQPGMVVRYQTRHAEGRCEIAAAISQLGWALEKARRGAELDTALEAQGAPAHLLAADGSDWQVLVHRAGSAWARGLRAGDSLPLRLADGTTATGRVTGLGPWGEKTRVALQVSGRPAPPPGTLFRVMVPRPRLSSLPAGLGIAAQPEERIEWFLSSIYCTCSIAGDRCTGHLFTLSLCDHKGCGKPNSMKQVLSGYIREGLTDAEILKRLLAEEGPELLVPHLLR